MRAADISLIVGGFSRNTGAAPSIPEPPPPLPRAQRMGILRQLRMLVDIERKVLLICKNNWVSLGTGNEPE